MIQEVVVREYEDELERAKQPDYVSRYDDFEMDYADYKRPAQPTATGDTRIDPPHQRHTPHVGNNAPHTASPMRDRVAAPPRPAARNSNRPTQSGFGAGIFPES